MLVTTKKKSDCLNSWRVYRTTTTTKRVGRVWFQHRKWVVDKPKVCCTWIWCAPIWHRYFVFNFNYMRKCDWGRLYWREKNVQCTHDGFVISQFLWKSHYACMRPVKMRLKWTINTATGESNGNSDFFLFCNLVLIQSMRFSLASAYNVAYMSTQHMHITYFTYLNHATVLCICQSCVG